MAIGRNLTISRRKQKSLKQTNKQKNPTQLSDAVRSLVEPALLLSLNESLSLFHPLNFLGKASEQIREGKFFPFKVFRKRANPLPHVELQHETQSSARGIFSSCSLQGLFCCLCLSCPSCGGCRLGKVILYLVNNPLTLRLFALLGPAVPGSSVCQADVFH